MSAIPNASGYSMAEGKYWRRYDCKKGRTPPPEFQAADDPDPVTGHWPGWVPVRESDPADKWLIVARLNSEVLYSGTYEAIGPHFQGNPEGVALDGLVKHGSVKIPWFGSISRETLKSFFVFNKFEGIVWHHDDGRMAKIKGKDFGIRRV